MTPSDVHAALDATITLAQAIVAGGPEGVPSGHLYAQLCGVMSLDAYERMIALLIRVGAITRRGDLLFGRVPRIV